LFKKYAVLLVGLWLVAPPSTAERSSELAEAIHRQLVEPRLTCLIPSVPLDPASLEGLWEFYQLEAFEPAWNGERLDGLIEQLEQLADDGLEPERYFLHALRQLRQIERGAPRLLACLDTLASQAYLMALRHLRVGRLDPATVEPIWHADGMAPVFDQPAFLLDARAGLDDLPAAFARARPAFEPYQALRRAYAAQRRQPLPVWLPVPTGPLLKPQAVDARVPLLERRLAAEGYLPDTVLRQEGRGDHLYGLELETAVRAFQRRHQLKEDGIVGPLTLAALNRSPAQRMEQLRLNLERLRWLSREVPETGVLVNVAGAEVYFLRAGQPVWQARTQVGRATRKTPLLKSGITHLTLNPTWTVPPTILREDKLPEIRNDLNYLAENRMRVFDREGNELDPVSVDWENPADLRLRQDAGPHNALGQVAIRFPNPFAVYLHDTPSQRLFESLPRTFSSGCVRVERVAELVELLLTDASAEQRERIARQWASGRTQRADLPRPIPILLAYWTVRVGEEGELLFYPDLYGYDARLLAALNAL
jgi:murein L,D-transpeptidase YcbB/YkuD